MMSSDRSDAQASTIRDARISALLVEDDEVSGHATHHFLVNHGVPTLWVRNGADALREAGRRTFDVVLLDLILPGQDGLDVCRALRAKSDVPVIILSARQTEDERIGGFDAGADDYLTKPFSPRELISRLLAVIRRVRGQVGPVRPPLMADGLHLDPATLTASRGERRLSLTSHEFNLLYALVARRGKIVSREQLIEAVGGSPDSAIERSVDVHVSRLRQKLGDDARHPNLLKTIRGAGYMFVGLPREAVDAGAAAAS
jgi:two-component system OmpR family response regulator